MTEDTEAKPRRRRMRIENHPEVKAWCDSFIANTEDNMGYTPTRNQALQAWLTAALKAIGAAG